MLRSSASFRRRMVLLAAGAVAAAIVIASVVVYVVTGNELRGQIDTSLREKLTPGPQAGRSGPSASAPARLAKFTREGKLAPMPRIGFGGPGRGKGCVRESAPAGLSGRSGPDRRASPRSCAQAPVTSNAAPSGAAATAGCVPSSIAAPAEAWRSRRLRAAAPL